ncbi:magnesium/cobalt transporter CorA [Marinisporobacter balticus]|uniref:Magnesium transport protein CorA n=1 Tax=Marinisporobacter balticus TaxID=2018667 RepID=A0A4R2KL64_9FIRM|nr:magnesium/cobalt transporter CorA [Marinisporobacter balticus]TCO74403.1 magnesium transporter [Marinisporobacter balticus]
MVHIMAITEKLELIQDIDINQMNNEEIKWYWVDFDRPSEEEVKLLESYFKFHALAIEDCMYFLQRPKLDYYEGYNFFVFHSLNEETLETEEVDVFVGKNYMVSFHKTYIDEIEKVRQKIIENNTIGTKNHIYILHLILDNIVDKYFPAVYKIEDKINNLGIHVKKHSIRVLVNHLFEIRNNLLKLRKTINSMRDLLYRITNSDHFKNYKEMKIYFSDIYDHLLKLSEMIESNRDVTSDIHASYLSINADRMNTIMMTFTLVTSIFVPLTFITGVYGMNFEYMPELKWHYGYFTILGVMLLVSLLLLIWFKIKGWFDA